MKKIFTVTPLWAHSDFVVQGNHTTTLDAVWSSIKCWFSEGSTVVISDGVISETFTKAKEDRV